MNREKKRLIPPDSFHPLLFPYPRFKIDTKEKISVDFSPVLTNDDLDCVLLPRRSLMADARAPEQETERRGIGGVLQVHLLGRHFAVIHDPHLH